MVLQLKHRVKALVCGWLDLVILLLNIAGTIIIVVFLPELFDALYGSTSRDIDYQQETQPGSSRMYPFERVRDSEGNADFTFTFGQDTDNKRLYRGKAVGNETVRRGVLIVVIVLASIIFLIKTSAAILLIMSTSQDREPRSALKMAMFWLVTNVSILVLSWLGIMGMGMMHWVSLIVSTIIQGGMICCVGLFIQELRVVTSSAQNSTRHCEANMTSVGERRTPVPTPSPMEYKPGLDAKMWPSHHN